jgi:uncharacterized protein YifN (PemK superfamily)
VDLPKPEPGLVIAFNYLWRREHEAGLGHGRYPRPCAIVVAYRRAADGALAVTVVPITTKEPRPDDRAVAIPPRVKRNLGLDAGRPSWAIVDEVNEFAWPGFDLATNDDGQIAYGFIPPKLHGQIRDALLAAAAAGRLKRTQR